MIMFSYTVFWQVPHPVVSVPMMDLWNVINEWMNEKKLEIAQKDYIDCIDDIKISKTTMSQIKDYREQWIIFNFY
jgi:hypothetical protein